MLVCGHRGIGEVRLSAAVQASDKARERLERLALMHLLHSSLQSPGNLPLVDGASDPPPGTAGNHFHHSNQGEATLLTLHAS